MHPFLKGKGWEKNGQFNFQKPLEIPHNLKRNIRIKETSGCKSLYKTNNFYKQ